MSCIIGTLVLCAAQVLWVPPLRGGTQWGILAAAPEWAPEVELGTLATEQGSAVSQWTESCSRHPWADPAIIPCSGGRCRGCCWCLPVIPLLLHASPVPAWTHHVFVVRDVRVLVRAAVIHLRIILPVIKLASGVSAISSLCLLVLVFLDLCLILLDLVCFWTVDIWLLVVGFVCLFGLPTPVWTFASSPSHKLYSFFCVRIHIWTAPAPPRLSAFTTDSVPCIPCWNIVTVQISQSWTQQTLLLMNFMTRYQISCG